MAEKTANPMIIIFTKIYRTLCRFGLRIALLVPLLAIADTPFTGKVVKIADGDTLTVLVDHQQIRVRLAQIDCPERAQPWSNRAKQALSDYAFGKVVEIVLENCSATINLSGQRQLCWLVE